MTLYELRRAELPLLKSGEASVDLSGQHGSNYPSGMPLYPGILRLNK